MPLRDIAPLAIFEEAEAVELGASLIQLAAEVMRAQIEVKPALLVLATWGAIQWGTFVRVAVIANSRPRFLSFHFATTHMGS